MRYFVSTLLLLICFPHKENIVIINLLSFIYPPLMVNHPPSLNGPYMLVMPGPPHVNYVTTCPMHSTLHEREYLSSPEIDPVVDMVISSIGILEKNLSTLIEDVDMYSFQSVFLPSSEDLLEYMADVYPLTCIPSRALSSWKP
jgi:hypothetical protein